MLTVEATAHWFRSGHECGQLTVTTASAKKRKLGKRDEAHHDCRERPHLASSGVSQGCSSLVPPSQRPLAERTGVNSLSCTPPSRCLPSHIQSEILERQGRSLFETSDNISTAASSPSAAYAGLTLDEESGANMTGGDLDRDGDLSLGSPPIAAGSPYVPSGGSLINGDSIPERSSSPAIKRPASELDDEADAVSRVAVSNGEGSSLKTVSMLRFDQGQSDFDRAVGLARRPARHTARYHDSSTVEESGSTNNELQGLPTPQSTQQKDMPSTDEQIARVTALSLKELREGDKGYLVSCKWVERVKARGSDRPTRGSVDKGAAEGEVGPIDNSDLVAQAPGDSHDLKDESGVPFIPLKAGLTFGEDFDIFPPEAWEMIVEWYGKAADSPTITRFVHNTNTEGEAGMENLQYEVYPPILTVVKLQSASTAQSTQGGDLSPVRTVASRAETFNHFLKRVKTMARIPLSSKVRVWRVLGNQPQPDSSGILTPAASRNPSPAPAATDSPLQRVNKKLLLDLNTFQSLENGTQRELVDIPDQTANENYNGRMRLALAGLNQDETIILEERIRGDSGGDWVSEATGKAASNAGVPISVTRNGQTTVQNRSKTRAATSSGRASPVSVAGAIMTRGRTQKNGRALGTCGLSNLGNTCYMNSALQCVRSVEELTQYFRLGKYKAELNPSNPLSKNGDFAKSYAHLLDQMYAPSCPASVAPRAFKNTIGRYGPSFSGYGQQDSQEFLGFLLDGLLEDLNRIQKKPNIEKPDSTDEMVNDPSALRQLADKCWEIYKARNDSVVVDLFAGTYKSTLVCPHCQKVSITFDPFTNLTLQIPIENMWNKEIYYFPLHDRPIRVMVDIDKNSSIKTLKEFVASRVKADPRRLQAVEIYKLRIYKVYEDSGSVSELIQPNDEVVIYELEDIPTNWHLPKEKQRKARPMIMTYNQSDDEDEAPSWESPLAEKMLVPIFHRVRKDPGTRFGGAWNLFSVPSYIVLSPEESRDYDAILRKVLGRVDTMTTSEIISGDAEESSEAPEEDDMILTTSEDADSSGGTKMKSQSGEGEEDFVTVSMRDDGETSSKASERVQRQPRSRRQSRNIRILKPETFITPELRNLFQMRVFTQTGELVPTGWSGPLEDDRDFPTIESRLPRTPSGSPPSEEFDRSLMLGDEASTESEDDLGLDRRHHSFRIQNPESDSDSDQLPPMHNILSRKKQAKSRSKSRNGIGIRRKGPKTKYTYSRKGKQLGVDKSGVEHDGGPLVRLGEGLLLDWTREAHDSLFQNAGIHDPMRGSATWEGVDLLPDEELQRKRMQRMNRRKTGVSLGDCLDEFGKEEILSENDPWYCPRCKEFRRATKKFELWKAPDVLIIHLKRFRGLRDKLDVLVDFPIEGLDLTERVISKDGKELVYDLFAVDNHYGGLGGGHYTAVARNFIDGNWYDYNDTMVSKKNPEHAVTSAAYLLFYRRRSDHPLGGAVFEEIITEAHDASESSSASRTSSPAGDGPFDDSSRVGSSTALGGVGAGIPEPTTLASERTAIENSRDEPPSYSSVPGSHNTGGDQMDVDEAVDTNYRTKLAAPFFEDPRWTFANNRPGTGQAVAVPPGSSDEDLMDGVSDKAANGSSDVVSDQGDRMADFADDDTTIDDVFTNTPDRSNLSRSPAIEFSLVCEPSNLFIKPPVVDDDNDDGLVAEVHVEKGEGLGKSA